MKGQISLATVITLGTIIAGAVATTFTMTWNNSKETALVSERTARLETSVPIIQQDIGEIKNSLKNIEVYFRIPTPK